MDDFGRDIYKERGYSDRNAYLENVANEHGVDAEIVFATAELLGPSEDFDGLIIMIEDGIWAGLI